MYLKEYPFVFISLVNMSRLIDKIFEVEIKFSLFFYYNYKWHWPGKSKKNLGLTNRIRTWDVSIMSLGRYVLRHKGHLLNLLNIRIKLLSFLFKYFYLTTEPDHSYICYWYCQGYYVLPGAVPRTNPNMSVREWSQLWKRFSRCLNF